VDNDDFDKKFSLDKTLTNIRNSSNATTDSSNAQLLNSLLKTFNVDLKTNGFVKMDLQKRAIVLIEITRAVLNSRMRPKFVLRGVRSMILNLKNNFADYNVISNLLVSLSNLTCSSQ
jgi:inorganic pyrophosphatase/exopolyphosphatase